MRFPTIFSWQIGAVFGVGALLGASAGVIAGYVIFTSQSMAVGTDLTRKTARVALLEKLVAQQSTSAGSLDQPVASANNGANQPAPVAPARVANPSTKAQIPSGSPAPMEILAAARRQIAANFPPAAEKPVAPSVRKKVEPVTDAELAEALKGKIDGVSADKAGVLRVERDAVYLKNGTVVRIGERFPSGEKLLQADPENSRVITSERQMLLFSPK